MISWRALTDTVFVLARDDARPIVYAPLQGVVMEANGEYVGMLERALGGDADAAATLGLDPDLLGRFTAIPAAATRRLDPAWPDAFEPTSVTVFLTNKCTLRCAYCYCDGGEGADMPWPVFTRAVGFALDNARRKGTSVRVAFHGGDVGAVWPLFERSVAFIEHECALVGVRPLISIGTNGFYDTAQAAFIAAHLQSATLSIDGGPEVHDRYRVAPGDGPSLARILNTVRVFEEAGLAYSVRMTVTAESLPCLAESVEFICRAAPGSRTIRAEPLYSRGRAAESSLQAPDPDAFVRAFREAEAFAVRYGRRLTYSGARIGGVSGAFCSYPAPTFGVTPDGDLTCCYEVLRADDPLGDSLFYGHIPPDGSTVTVDRGRIDAIRARALERRAACRHCFCVFACAGDCAAKVLDADLPQGSDSTRCRITRALVYDMVRATLPTSVHDDAGRVCGGE